VWLEEWDDLKNPVTSSGIEPTPKSYNAILQQVLRHKQSFACPSKIKLMLYGDNCDEDCLIGCNAMTMEVICYSETFDCFRTTRRYNTEEGILKIAIHVNSDVQNIPYMGPQFSSLRQFFRCQKYSIIISSYFGLYNVPDRKIIKYLLGKFSLCNTS
jgi:hypothetical protein